MEKRPGKILRNVYVSNSNVVRMQPDCVENIPLESPALVKGGSGKMLLNHIPFAAMPVVEVGNDQPLWVQF